MNAPDRFAERALPALAPGPAAAVAGLSYLLPLLLSIGATPSPANPRTLAWYAGLRKPRWAPPDAAVPLVWAALETGLAAGAYRLLRRRPGAPRARALAAWAVNVAMIGGWSRMFFRGRDLRASTVGAAAMVATGAAYVASARQVDPPAAKAALPYLGWVLFATVLTASMRSLNRR